MKFSKKKTAAGLSVCAVVLLLLASASAQKNAAATDDTYDAVAAADYCTATGGMVETRYPYFGTNLTNPLRLAGMRQFCQYTQKNGGSRIHVLLSTLVATKPTLAALAYYAKVPLGQTGGGNPASYYCTQLGGTDLFGGINFAGGGWVEWGAIDESLEACIFPDMSSIDSWGLTYHSANIIRGINLGRVLKYHKGKKK
jgi:putative hemolysin